MTVELLDTEEAQADDPLDVQVTRVLHTHTHTDQLLNVDILALVVQ